MKKVKQKACANCKHANRSGNEDFVFCKLWQKKANEANMTSEDYVVSTMLNETKIDKVGIGWAYPNQQYREDAHWSTEGTATEGLMWNMQICVHKDEACQFFESTEKAKY